MSKTTAVSAAERANRVFYEKLRKDELKKLSKLPVPDFKRILSPAEWDFTSCSPEEGDLCLDYELAREIPTLRQMAHNYRHSIIGKSQKEVAVEQYGLRILFPCLAFAFDFPQWPEKPWLAISDATRRQAATSFGWASLHADPMYLLDETPFPHANTVQVKYGRTIVYPRFQIDLAQQDASIMRDFSAWLAFIRSNTGQKPHGRYEQRGRTSTIKVLTWLGVYRLMKRMSWKKVQIKLQERGIKAYESHSSLTHASNRGQQAIDQFAMDNLPPR